MKQNINWGTILTDLGLPINCVNKVQLDYISKWSTKEPPDIKIIWEEMDRAWEYLNLDNTLPLDGNQLKEFYSHPIWIINGLFTIFDPLSNHQRGAIAKTVQKLAIKKVADFGGGFCALANHIAKLSNSIQVDIIEPFPSTLAPHLLQKHPNAKLTTWFEGNYDCIIAQDVLEHLEDPIYFVSEIVNRVNDGGYVVFANCFKPVVKCHLPSTFHLRHTFTWVIEPLGLKYCSRVKGADHAILYKKCEEKYNIKACRRREKISKSFNPGLNNICSIARLITHYFLNVN